MELSLVLIGLLSLVSVTVQGSPLSASTQSKSLKFVGEANGKSDSDGRLGKNPEVDMNTTQLIRSYGYPVESHKVVTEDGYILGIFRIPHGRHNKHKIGPRPVVYMQHGLLGNCDDFIINPANESLGFLLADAGADVWLGNTRGNIHSRQHTTLDPHKLKFWEFSWDDIAQYDLPATIYYILNQTGDEQLYYVGHSQGTAIGFARFSEDQEVASRVKHFIALAPIGRVVNTPSPLRLLVPYSSEIVLFLDIFGHGIFDIPGPILRLIAGNLCEQWGEVICENALFLICGFNAQSFNMSRTDVYVSHGSGGSSARNVLQWAQNIRDGQFQHFDYGEKENLARYGQKTPPAYNPRNINVPIAVFRGGHDWLADNRDVAWLLPQLKNLTHDVYIPRYEHLDPVFGFDAVTYMYKDLIKIIMG